MESVVGISKKTNVKEALDEALKGVSHPLGILFFTDYGRLEEVGAGLQERFPDAQMIGTAGTAYYNTTVSEQDLLIVSAITGQASVSADVIEHLSTSPLSELYRLEDSVRQVSPGKEDSVCLEVCTNDEERLVSTLNMVLEKKKIPLIGGSVFGTPEGKPSLVVVNGKIYEDACAYMMVKNTSGKVHVFRENIYGYSGGPAHVATKVNLKDKELIELDNRPAAEVYSAETGVAKGDIVNNVFQQPLGRVVDGQVFISSMRDISPKGSLFNFKRINENDQIYVLKLLDYKEIVRQSINEIRSRCARPSLVVSVNCVYRYLFFQSEGYLQEYLKEMSNVGSFVGYIAGGEQYKKQHVNQTMVCAIFE